VSDARPLRPGTVEHARADLIEATIERSVFTAREHHDETGAPADDPAIRLQSVRLASAPGLRSRRTLDALGGANVGCLAWSADTPPPCTTMAARSSAGREAMARLVREVRLVCDAAGLLGRERGAVDGVKRPGHASTAGRGTRADLTPQAEKRPRAGARLRHTPRRTAAAPGDAAVRGAEARPMQTRPAAIRQREDVRAPREERRGRSGRPIQRQSTANDSAQRPTRQGVVPGDTGAAMAEARPQVLVRRDASGAGQEHGLRSPRRAGVRATCGALGGSSALLPEVKRAADAGDARAAPAPHAFDPGREASRAGTHVRPRDPRCTDAGRHQPTRPEAPLAKPRREGPCQPQDCHRAAAPSPALCPAGTRLDTRGGHEALVGRQTVRCRAPLGACRDGPRRAACRRPPRRAKVRQVAFSIGRTPGKPAKSLATLQRTRASAIGRSQDSRRLGSLAPGCGHLRHTQRRQRLTLRRRRPVNPPWPLCCLGHTLETRPRDGRIARAANGGGRQSA
jgi:hypothetical protein